MTKNFHLPLPENLYEELAGEAKQTGRPATVVARRAIETWLRQRRQSQLHEAIGSYASRRAGSKADLDSALEAASVESLRNSEKSL